MHWRIKLNRKKIIGLCGVVAILIAFISTMYIHNTISGKKPDEKASGNKSGVYFSEVYYSQEQLIDKSDLVVKCEFKGEKETKIVSGMTSDGNGKQSRVEGTVTRYKMKTVEVLKGSADKEITVLIAGEGDDRLQKGEEYVLFLTKNPDGSY
jgi:hypothetical protein